MPIYEYLCKDCENKFEELVLNPDDDIFCNLCEGHHLEKMFSTFGFKSESALSSTSETMNSGCMCTPTTCGCGSK